MTDQDQPAWPEDHDDMTVAERQPPPDDTAFADAVELSDDDLLAEFKAADSGRGVVEAASGVHPNVEAALQFAIRELRAGVCEQGTNRGIPWHRYVKYFNDSWPPEPWCAFFVSWCWDRATDQNRRVPWGYPGAVRSVQNWARTHGKIVNAPRRGDVFGTGTSHMGWVLRTSGSGFVSVEGNTSSGCVRANQRSSSGLWFARIV